MKTSPNSEAEFWTFSVQLYGQPRVPDVCIDLQETHDIDINVLFYLLFCAARSEAFDEVNVARLDTAVQPWREGVVRPLRTARRALKTDVLSALANDEDTLRNTIKTIELQAEKLQQYALARLGASLPVQCSATPVVAMDISWRAYVKVLNTQLPENMPGELLAALSAIPKKRGLSNQ
tara:strand:+ start:727 stop:1260 length:534 start_codon:yes stop_codon:yes gene_type:complete